MGKIIITFHYEGLKKVDGAGRLHVGTLVDHGQEKELKENTTPGLFIFTNHEIEGYTKESVWNQILQYADDRYERPFRIRFKTDHQMKTRLYK